MPNCFLCQNSEALFAPRISPYITVQCPVCGFYTISGQLEALWNITPGMEDNRKHLISAYTRKSSDEGNAVTITTGNLQKIFDSIPKFSSPLVNLDLTLLLVMRRQSRADEYALFKFGLDYPLVYARDLKEFLYFAETLRSQGLLEGNPGGTINSEGFALRLTPSGWQRALDLQKSKINSNQAFVAMWFGTELDEAWEKGIKPALESTGFKPYRVDQDQHNGKIDDRIISEIRRSGLLVADFTAHRGGVYFEAGFAMGLEKPVIWTCKETDIENAHFDTRQYNHITWKEPSDLKEKLAFRIAATIPGRAIK
jgi:nucleoside 2-deoxyribosyltransferase